MIKVAFVRGKYLNNYEGQNYRFNKKRIALTGIANKFPLDSKVDFPVIRLPSLVDFDTRLTKIVTNRTLGDSQILFGLEKVANQFDIFHTADPHYYYSYQLAKLREKGIIRKLLSTSWETIPFNNETVYRKKFIKRFSIKYADHFLCYTQKAKECLIREGANENEIEVIKIGVDLGLFRSNRNRPKVPKLLFVGRLVEEKGILDLYKAFKKIKTGKLLIIGSGPLESELKRLIRQDGMTNSITMEKKSYEQMPAVYQEADVFVMPSKRNKTWEEQYGMVLIEAMASGLPVVAYNTGAIAENLGAAGILVNGGNTNDLTRQILRVIQDKNLASKLGTMGRKRAEEVFDSRKAALKIQSLYESLNSNLS